MDEMMTRYIFKHMRITESRLDMMGKDLVRQVKLNKRTTRFAVAATGVYLCAGIAFSLRSRTRSLSYVKKWMS